MRKAIYILMLALTLVACGKSKVDQLVDVLNDATTQIEKCSDRDEIMKVETVTQQKINDIVGTDHNFKPTEEDAKVLEPALNAYYQAFYNKAVALGLDEAPVTEEEAEITSEEIVIDSAQ